ncbi:MAG: hypothetical protein GX133_10000 [Syntrophomonadaceae bacterium]|nr:hypothetical protein [Syntrophomonadaceae bacterium]
MEENKTMLNLAALENESPERLAQLIIDLSQIMDGAIEEPRKTFSYSLIQKIVNISNDELTAMMKETLRLLPLYFSIVQHVLLHHVERPEDLDKILDTMENHQRSGARDNEYLQVVKNTYTRTRNNTEAVYARMEQLSAEMDRFEQRSDENNDEFKARMAALSVELEREQQEVFAKTDALLEKLEEITSGTREVVIEPPPKRTLVTVTPKMETYIIALVVVLFVIILISMLSMAF